MFHCNWTLWWSLLSTLKLSVNCIFYFVFLFVFRTKKFDDLEKLLVLTKINLIGPINHLKSDIGCDSYSRRRGMVTVSELMVTIVSRADIISNTIGWHLLITSMISMIHIYSFVISPILIQYFSDKAKYCSYCNLLFPKNLYIRDFCCFDYSIAAVTSRYL